MNMALTKNAIYYFLKSKRISIASIARKNNVTRQSIQGITKRKIWQIKLNTYYRISEMTDQSIGQVVDEILKIDDLKRHHQELDDDEFVDYLRWGFFD